MKWLLVIYLSNNWLGLPSRVTEFPDKANCYEALSELRKTPKGYHLAFCEPKEQPK